MKVKVVDDSKPRRRGGRPALPEGQRRDSRIIVTVNDEEMEQIRSRARKQRRTPSAYLRWLGLRSRQRSAPPAATVAAYARLGDLARRLRVAAGCPQEGEPPEAVKCLLLEASEELQAIRLQLLTGVADR